MRFFERAMVSPWNTKKNTIFFFLTAQKYCFGVQRCCTDNGKMQLFIKFIERFYVVAHHIAHVLRLQHFELATEREKERD